MCFQKSFYLLVLILGYLDRHCDLSAVSGLFDRGAKRGKAPGQILELAVADPGFQAFEQYMGLDVGDFKHLPRCLTIGACQSARPQLDPTKIADDGEAHVDQPLALEMGENGSSRSARGFTGIEAAFAQPLRGLDAPGVGEVMGLGVAFRQCAKEGFQRLAVRHRSQDGDEA